MARGRDVKIDYQQAPLIEDMRRKRAERFKFKKTPPPVLSRPKIAAEPEQAATKQAEPPLRIWWPTADQLKQIEANWAFFVGFLLTAFGSGALMVNMLRKNALTPVESIPYLIGLPFAITLCFLIAAFFIVRIVRFLGGPITTVTQLGRFRTLSTGAQLGMVIGLLIAFIRTDGFASSPRLHWQVFQTLGWMGMLGGIFSWIERNVLHISQTPQPNRDAFVDVPPTRSIFDTTFYREILPALAALAIGAMTAMALIADAKAKRTFELHPALYYIAAQTIINVLAFRITARMVSGGKASFGYRNPADLA